MTYLTTPIALEPVFASLEEAMSYIICGKWGHFPELHPWYTDEASAALCKLAHRGFIQLTGSPRLGCGPIGNRSDIPASFFLYPVEIDLEMHMITAVDDHPRWPHSYIEVQVCVQSLKDAVPALPAKQINNATMAEETSCKKWLIGEMRKNPSERAMSKEMAKGIWQSKGHKIGDKAFGRAWANAVLEANAPAWSAPGRQKKNRFAEIAPPL